MRAPLRLIPREMPVRILQGRLRGKRWIVGSFNHGCWLGSYEHDKVLRFQETVKPGHVVFDVGAHVGYYTLLASELAGPHGQVIAFEPLPRNLRYLHEHLRLNSVQNVRVIEAAVSDRSGTARFRVVPDSSMGAVTSDASADAIEVETVSLDDLFARGEIPAPNVLKIDVEGAEASVLAGAEKVIAEARPAIFLATHGAEVHAKCCRFLNNHRYKLTPLNGESIERCDEVLALPEGRAGSSEGPA